ncbi:class II fructose-bisphosphate aldolase family protein [Patescibacteria group bacterium]|nr:class II fructose-bisphosphate aldolase family protein [Patescibacteria group bacterium]
MLVHLKEIVSTAIKKDQAIGAFNTMNLEITQGIVKGAVSSTTPIIIQVTEGVIKYAGLSAIFGIMSSVIENDSGQVPIAIHLDHGKDLEVIKDCVDIGFSSVHCDASKSPFEDNIKLTKVAADYAHQHNVWIQGELGNILGKEGLLKFHQGENLNKSLTDPQKIKEYVERTGVDTVAVSIGNLHGSFVGLENLNLELLDNIRKNINIPIVLHGGSGISSDQIKEAIKLGIRIINIDTELRQVFSSALKETLLMEKKIIDPRKILSPVREAISQKVSEKCHLFSN